MADFCVNRNESPDFTESGKFPKYLIRFPKKGSTYYLLTAYITCMHTKTWLQSLEGKDCFGRLA
jgi:hypothetical protein